MKSHNEFVFNYGDTEIVFKLVKIKLSSNKILIKVHPDCRVIVTAHETAENEDILAAVKKRGRWIYKQICEFQRLLEYSTPRKYVSGESHYYLGHQYLLKVIKNSNHPQNVKLLRGKLEVSISQKDPEKIKKLLAEWYKIRAHEVFSKRLKAMMEVALWVPTLPPMRIQTMKTEWGSCSPSGCLTLNPHLVKAPRECIDYVILHELCHIAEHNHSKQFYRLMNQVMPRWETTKERLDRMALIIIT